MKLFSLSGMLNEKNKKIKDEPLLHNRVDEVVSKTCFNLKMWVKSKYNLCNK